MALMNTVRRGLRSLARQRTVWVVLATVVVAVALALLVRKLARKWRRSYRYEGAASGPDDCKKSGKWWDASQSKCRKAEQCRGTVKDGSCVAATGDDSKYAGCATKGKFWSDAKGKCMDPKNCKGTVTNGVCSTETKVVTAAPVDITGDVRYDRWIGCSTDGTSDDNVFLNWGKNHPDTGLPGMCCQGTGEWGKEECYKMFAPSKCCEGPRHDNNGNCPGRGKTVADGC